MLKIKNIIITGGSGLVGSAFKKIKNNYQNTNFIFLNSKQADLTDYKKSKEVFKSYNPCCVIHLAAYVGGLFKNINNNVEMYEKNMLINLNVLRICHELNINKVICCLSTCIFPDNIKYPINETQLHLGPPHTSNIGYSYAKRMLEIHCSLYNKQYNRKYICVIPTNIYGEYDNFSLTDGHVIPALIHKCLLSQINNEDFVVFGTGKPVRQFIYSIDLAKLIMLVLKNYQETNPIILSTDQNDEVSIKYVAEKIHSIFKNKNKIIFDTSFSDGQYKKTADNKKLKELFKDFKFTDINTGLTNTIEWFKNNYPNKTRI